MKTLYFAAAVQIPDHVDSEDQYPDYARDALRHLGLNPDTQLVPGTAFVDPTLTMLGFTREVGIAVHYCDRAYIESRLDVTFTEDEWERLKPYLTDYDEEVEAGVFVADTTYDILAGFCKSADVNYLERD